MPTVQGFRPRPVTQALRQPFCLACHTDHLDGLVFWCVVVGVPAIAGFLMRARKSRWTGIPFLVLVVLAIVIPVPGISLAIAMGIFGTVFCLAHLAFLFPDFCQEMAPS